MDGFNYDLGMIFFGDLMLQKRAKSGLWRPLAVLAFYTFTASEPAKQFNGVCKTDPHWVYV